MTASGHASGTAVIGVTVATTILAGLAVISRIFTRTVIVRRFGLDDLCISAAMILTIALTITMCQQVKYGMGQHFTTLTDGDIMHLMQWFWASVWIYYSSLCFTKISILLQYLRVFPSEGFRKSCYILMGIIVAYSLATFLTSVFSCVPVASFWDTRIKGTCVNRKAVWFTNATINIVTDICTGILPIPTLNSLNLPRRQKYALIAVFALGGFTCIVSILRLQSLYIVSNSDDLTWDNPLAAIWSSTETNVGIICSCLPTLKGCITRFLPRLFSSGQYLRDSSGRQGPDAGRIPSKRLDESFPRAIELGDGDNLVSKSHIRISEDMVHPVSGWKPPQPIRSHPYEADGISSQASQSKEELESRGSDVVQQHRKALSSHQVV